MQLANLKNRLDEYHARLTNYALDKGFMSGGFSYARFIVLSRSRSGSNYMVDLLNSHEGIRCFNELFSRNGKTYWGLPGFGSRAYRSESLKQLKENDPVSFLLKYVYSKYPASVSSVGFKLFYNQAKKGRSRILWRYLSEQRELKIIHLKRLNMLNVVASRKVAEVSHEWVKRGRSSANKKIQIELSHDECLTQFEKTKRWEMEKGELFSKHKVMDVYYEDLVSDTENVMSNVQHFLGVESKHLFSTTRKQSARPIAEVITNYEELKAGFKDTEWEEYFCA